MDESKHVRENDEGAPEPSESRPDDIGEAATLPAATESNGGFVLPRPTRGGLIDAAEQARVFEALFQVPAKKHEIGRYVVLGTRGRGGMGTVFEAFDRTLDRRVAIKVLHQERDDKHTARLLREAQAMAKLSHPNVVQVYEAGEIEGHTFVAMELVQGKTLEEWIRQQPRPDWRQCVKMFIRLGAGLAAAHERGLVHRDFKPSNAIIDDKGRPRVLDFGLARKTDAEQDDESSLVRRVRIEDELAIDTTLTRTGAVLGTPAYMPPEQMNGREADARSDQFSFCVALYEAVYDDRPFNGDSMAALMVSVQSGKVRPAPKGSKVPAKLRTVLLRGLALDPAQRWPSIEALLGELHKLVAPRTRRWMALGMIVGLSAVGGGVAYQAEIDRQAERAHRAELARLCSGAAAQLDGIWDDTRRQDVKAAILGTELSYAPDTWERVAQRLDDYAEAWIDEHTEVCEATAVRHEQSPEVMDLRMGCLHERRLHVQATVDELSRADATVVQNAVQAVESLPKLERCADMDALKADQPPPEDPVVAERVATLDEQLVEAKAKQEAGKYQEGLAVAEEVVAGAKTLDYEPLMARAWLRQGWLQQETGDYEGAVKTLQQAYDAALARRMMVEAAEASAHLVYVLGWWLARLEEARRWATHADPLSRAAGSDEVRAEYLDSVGIVTRAQGKLDEARDLLERSLTIRQTLGPQHPNLAKSLNSLGIVAYLQGKLDEARDFHERARAISEKALGSQHPDVADSLRNLGLTAFAQGKLDEARDFLERARAIFEKALGLQHPNVAISLNYLGMVTWSQGKLDEAREFHELALAILEKAVGPDHLDVSVSLDGLGIVARSQGKLDEAREFHERALAIREKAVGPQHADVAISLDFLGTVARLQGKPDEARDFHERALAIREKAFGPNNPYVADSLTGLGEALLGLAKPAEALTPLERALALRTTHEVDAASLAETRFALARALWTAPTTQGRNRPCARGLAEQARDAWAKHGAGREEDLAKVERWLAERLPRDAG